MIKIAGAAAAASGRPRRGLIASPPRRATTPAPSASRFRPAPSPKPASRTFELADDEIEIGMGAHGEPGVVRQKMTAGRRRWPTRCSRLLLKTCPSRAATKCRVLCNNLGSTTMMELLIVNRRVHKVLGEAGSRARDRHRQLPDLPGDGRLLHHPYEARRRAGPVLDVPADPSPSRRSDRWAQRTSASTPPATCWSHVAHAHGGEHSTTSPTVDRAIGDGDHGLGMQHGFRRCGSNACPPQKPHETVVKVLHGVASRCSYDRRGLRRHLRHVLLPRRGRLAAGRDLLRRGGACPLPGRSGSRRCRRAAGRSRARRP